LDYLSLDTQTITVFDISDFSLLMLGLPDVSLASLHTYVTCSSQVNFIYSQSSRAQIMLQPTRNARYLPPLSLQQAVLVVSSPLQYIVKRISPSKFLLCLPPQSPYDPPQIYAWHMGYRCLPIHYADLPCLPDVAIHQAQQGVP